MNVSYYGSISEPKIKDAELKKILDSIQTGHWKKPIEEIRNCLLNGETVKASKLKSKLPAFTVSATFNKSRTQKHLDNYSSVIHLDYDKVEDISQVKQSLCKIKYTYCVFVSPSGNGLKVFVRVDSKYENHLEAFNTLREYYDSMVGVDSDKSVKDVTRLCFLSYDPDLYINSKAPMFNFYNYMEMQKSVSKTQDFDKLWEFTSNVDSFHNGNRNNFIYKLSCNAIRWGIEKEDLVSHYSYKTDTTFTLKELQDTINSAYHNNYHEFASLANSANPAVLKHDSIENLDTPKIEDHIYENLPDILRRSCEVFSDREKDIYLTSALTVISGGLDNIKGMHAGEIVYPNIFSFIIASAASGKSAMKYAKKLGDCYHEMLLSESKELNSEYKQQLKVYEFKVKKIKNIEEFNNLIKPEKPKFKLYFIPGNTSSSMLIDHLESNDGAGCICETETDTLTGSLKQEWGNFSDILRKALHHETISRSRKTDLEYNEINEPKFSVCLTGTPDQIYSLINSTSNGLFSRFLFYTFNKAPMWRSTYTKNISFTKEELFKEFTEKLCYKFKNKENREFSLTEAQGGELDNKFGNQFDQTYSQYQGDSSSVVFRLGNICYKIAMILSALRSDETTLVCKDVDFETAMYLTLKIYLKHDLEIFKVLNKNVPNNLKEENLLKHLPMQFKRLYAINKAKELGIPERTADSILKKWVKQKVIYKIDHGMYSKT